MSCCKFVIGDGFVGISCSGNAEDRWIRSECERQEAEWDRFLFENEPVLLDNVCTECGRKMFEDTPGILECLCGERLRLVVVESEDE